MYGVLFCQPPSTMFTTSLCYAKLLISSSTFLTYRWFIDLEVVYLPKKKKNVHIKPRDAKRTETSYLNIRQMRVLYKKQLQNQTQESSTKTTNAWRSKNKVEVSVCVVLRRHDMIHRFLLIQASSSLDAATLNKLHSFSLLHYIMAT